MTYREIARQAAQAVVNRAGGFTTEDVADAVAVAVCDGVMKVLAASGEHHAVAVVSRLIGGKISGVVEACSAPEAICECGDFYREHDAEGCKTCRQSAHEQLFQPCRVFRPVAPAGPPLGETFGPPILVCACPVTTVCPRCHCPILPAEPPTPEPATATGEQP